MRFTRLAIATALLQLFAAACSPPQNAAQTDAVEAPHENPVVQRAEQGDAEAQLALGYVYWNGKGVPQDYVQAVKWFRKAAEQGNADAHNALGDAYRKGEGVPQDYAQAVTWFRKAAEQGNADAQNALSDAYRKGEGVSQDYAQSVHWRRKVAEQGVSDAQIILSDAYRRGEGVTRDLVLAYSWMNLATTSLHGEYVSASNEEQQAEHAFLEHMPPLSDQSRRWTAAQDSQQGARSRLESAKSVRDSVAEKLSPAQLAEAQRLSSNWQKGQSIQRERQ
jgi:TPR repeat protein